MLKITLSEMQPCRAFPVVEGRLAGPWVQELNAYCRKMSETTNVVR